MMQVTNAEKNIASLVASDHDSVLPRMAHVVAVNGHMVQVRFAEEAVAGETWFPSTIADVPVGAYGAVVPMRGNAAYFQPIGFAVLMKPKSVRGTQNLSTTRTTSGDIEFTSLTTAGVPTLVVGLQPNTAYRVTVDVFISMSSASTGSFRIVATFPTGGTEQVSGFVESLTSAQHPYYWKWAGQVTSNPNGEISVMPVARWESGSITSSRAEMILRVDPI